MYSRETQRGREAEREIERERRKLPSQRPALQAKFVISSREVSPDSASADSQVFRPQRFELFQALHFAFAFDLDGNL